MFGISYGELFLLLGATAAVIGPKDLPIIARTVGRLAGRAIGYVQLARGQFDNIMQQQSQVHQLHKEMKDALAQFDAIRHEMRSASLLNPSQATWRVLDNLDKSSATKGNLANGKPENLDAQSIPEAPISEVSVEQTHKVGSKASDLCTMHSQATAYARLAESLALKDAEKPNDDDDFLNVLPVSAKCAEMLPKRQGDVKGSDILLEAVLEAEVARNAKDFCSQPQNQIKVES